MLTTVNATIASTMTTSPVGPRIWRLRGGEGGGGGLPACRGSAGGVGGAELVTVPSRTRDSGLGNSERPLTGYAAAAYLSSVLSTGGTGSGPSPPVPVVVVGGGGGRRLHAGRRLGAAARLGPGRRRSARDGRPGRGLRLRRWSELQLRALPAPEDHHAADQRQAHDQQADQGHGEPLGEERQPLQANLPLEPELVPHPAHGSPRSRAHP